MTITEVTGLELMKLTATTDDQPPVATLIGLSIDEVDYGRVTMSIQTRPDFANPLGTVQSSHRDVGVAGGPVTAAARPACFPRPSPR